MYEIKIIDSTNGELPLDMIETSFPINIEANDIAELRDLSASWSYTIKLPKTPNNSSVFSYAGTPFVQTSAPYKRFLCNVYADGLQIIKNGVLFLNKVTTNYYEAQILSGVANFFEILNDIDFENGEDLYNAKAPVLTTSSSDGVFFPFLYIGGGINTTTKLDGAYKYAVPCVILKDIMLRLQTITGYTFLLDYDMWATTLSKIFMVVPKRKNIPNSAGQVLYRIEAYNEATTRRFAPKMVSQDSQYDEVNGVRPAFSQGGTQWRCTKIRIAAYNTKGSLDDFFSSGQSIMYSVGRYTRSIDRLSQMTYDNQKGCYYFETTEFDLDAATDASITTGDPDGIFWADCQYVFELIQTEDSEHPLVGGRFPITPNLGFKTAQDFLKSICQIFGWTVVVDNNNKTVQMFNFDHIISRKANAIDWTYKMDMSGEVTTSFEFGKYAKRNDILLSQDKITGFQDSVSFFINSDKLDSGTSLFTSPFVSGKYNTTPLYERNEDGTIEWKGADYPHLMISDNNTLTHYDASRVLANYEGITQAISYPTIIEGDFFLSPLDIVNHDQFTPIFLSQYGSYFYVNKISNWEKGKLCKVELVKI